MTRPVPPPAGPRPKSVGYGPPEELGAELEIGGLVTGPVEDDPVVAGEQRPAVVGLHDAGGAHRRPHGAEALHQSRRPPLASSTTTELSGTDRG